MKIILLTLFLYFQILSPVIHSQCVHDTMIPDAPRHMYNDLTDRRLLQDRQEGRLRIFVDYTQVNQGSPAQINMIKRATNITASYFYQVLNVTRLSRLYYPSNQPRKCNTLQIPQKYVTEGTIGDVGVACGNVNLKQQVYVAKSIACAYLESNKRPFWGIMVWNNAFLKYDQEGFQRIAYVGIHQMTHILGFSAVMYDLYPAGSPIVRNNNGDYFMNTPKIIQQINKHFNCNQSLGVPLEDQDGTLIASHWQRKVMGNQMMIATNRKGAYTSFMTLALLEHTGWYTHVNYDFAEPTTWGKGQGCKFLDIDDCSGKQFCQDNNFGCDADGTAIGRCSSDLFTGACKTIKYYTNTICVDQFYELKNLNSKLNALERGGSNSRCFSSNYRSQGLAPSKLNNRCYVSVCSFSRNFMYLLVGKYIIVCRDEGQVIAAPPGLQGTLTCPDNFDKYCNTKKTCPYHCNKNGICVDGQCMCTGTTQFSQTCVDISIYKAPIGDTGVLLNNLASNTGMISLIDLQQGPSTAEQISFPSRQITIYSAYSQCSQGTVPDIFWGGCLKCNQVYNCNSCNENGCLICDNNSQPQNISGINRCPPNSQQQN